MITRAQPWLGTLVEISADSDAAIDAGFAAIARVHRALNAHDRGSELSHANRNAPHQPVRLSRMAAAVIGRAQFWAARSDGAFDASAGHWRAVQLTGRTLRYAVPLALDLSGIAKGFAVDRAVVALRRTGTRHGLVNAGGDMRGFGAAWPVSLVRPDRAPVAKITLHDASLATSALRPDGSDDHLRGLARGIVSASVECRRAIDADALAKIVAGGGPRVAACLDTVGAVALVIGAGGELTQIGNPDRLAA
ncbi:FAD:protein FMN transferase [Polymorphobacter arshaanensis]|uniref:FAD:protein FMN transferase n=1 Tax=Glacieibacterium arshaanense TaxID=2511025 RepID=UPI001407305C|nr:FAD:protein FMN transferase [Polymorphobacter arshaanensis]